MTIGSTFAILAGFGVASYFFVVTGPATVLEILGHAGYGVAVVIAFHFFQILFDSLAWRALLAFRIRPRLGSLMLLRWIREGINNLLPVAQIGGEVVGARLLSLFGVGMAEAAASTTIDLTLEVLGQVAFTLTGVVLLVHLGRQSAPLRGTITYAVIGLTTVGLAFAAAQWAGLFRIVEQGLVRVAGRFGWPSLAEVVGLHRAIIEIWRTPGAAPACAAGHFISWLLGGMEVMLACHYLGHSISLRQGIVLESVSQAMKSMGFLVPGGLGVQEGGLLLLGPLCGLPASDAMALSLVKRLREMVLGVPALIACHSITRRFGNAASAIETATKWP